MNNKTIIEALQDSLTATARYYPDDVARPATVLWKDIDRRLHPVVGQLQLLIPELFILGEYLPENRN